jgi:hypothetical protein
MMHLLVEDVAAWQAQVEASQIAARYGVRVTELVTQPWRMKDSVCTIPPAYCGASHRISTEDGSPRG